MILIDSSIWIDHLRSANPVVTSYLAAYRVLGHPFITGEIALGGLREANLIIRGLHELPQATIAEDDEVLDMITRNSLARSGIGYVDAHLLTAVRLSAGAGLWTRDKRLLAVAERLNLSANPLH